MSFSLIPAWDKVREQESNNNFQHKVDKVCYF